MCLCVNVFNLNTNEVSECSGDEVAAARQQNASLGENCMKKHLTKNKKKKGNSLQHTMCLITKKERK